VVVYLLLLDRFWFFRKDITELHPSKIAIKWRDDLENVIWEVKSGLTPKNGEKINLSEPIDISYESNGYGLKFYLEDGHHRYLQLKQ
jgi:hypothetical protein